jgi:hypothetical protein
LDWSNGQVIRSLSGLRHTDKILNFEGKGSLSPNSRVTQDLCGFGTMRGGILRAEHA